MNTYDMLDSNVFTYTRRTIAVLYWAPHKIYHVMSAMPLNIRNFSSYTRINGIHFKGVLIYFRFDVQPPGKCLCGRGAVRVHFIGYHTHTPVLRISFASHGVLRVRKSSDVWEIKVSSTRHPPIHTHSHNPPILAYLVPGTWYCFVPGRSHDTY